METIHELMQQSAGVGAGVALGSAVGFYMRKRSGNTQGLLADSVFVTSAVVGIVGMMAYSLVLWLGIF
ncbi:hypothetical protein [Shimia abyssi]|uniref:Uncharacterized protein n=1 Tax=Shimia abyssi TaxID=1662395 RepID=A0A2P8FC80_9RHOB|nr:hypothetical protein [Shimia abyssi]PSL19314.1 hypothetical protein CLV88_10625 [Shimia abyssi]